MLSTMNKVKLRDVTVVAMNVHQMGWSGKASLRR